MTSKLLILFLTAFSAAAYGQTAPPTIKLPENQSVSKSSPAKLSDLVGLKDKPAPSFILPAMDGAEYNLENSRGKIIVMNLWGTFCAPCIEEMPALNALVAKYTNKNVVFLAPTPDDKATLEIFLEKHKFDYQVLPNGFGVIKNYAPHKKSDDPQKPGGFMMILPTHLVIDQNGIVTYHDWGFGKETAQKISAEIEKLLAARNVSLKSN